MGGDGADGAGGARRSAVARPNARCVARQLGRGGEAFGKLATATLDIEPGEAGATGLAYHLRVAGSPPMSYSAEASYAFDAKQRVRGKWTDSSGRTRAVAGGANAAKWWTHWGSADVEIGRSTYSLQADGTLVVNDSVLQDDGSWRVFAMLHYRRKNP